MTKVDTEEYMSIRKRIAEWMESKTGVGIIPSDDENYFESGLLDSYSSIELVEFLEDEFKIRFDNRDFQDRRFATLNGLSALVEEKRRAS